MSAKSLYFIGLILFLCFSAAFSQSEISLGRNHIDLKPREIRKLTLIELKKGTKKFPDSYLLGMRNDHLILATDISTWLQDPIFVKSEINIKNYDYLTMMERKEAVKQMTLWGALLGAGGYMLVNRNSKPTPYEARNHVLLGQSPNNGVLESVIGGVTGIAIGTIIGRFVAKKKINLRNEERRAVRKLKEVSFY